MSFVSTAAIAGAVSASLNNEYKVKPTDVWPLNNKPYDPEAEARLRQRESLSAVFVGAMVAGAGCALLAMLAHNHWNLSEMLTGYGW